MTQLLPCPFCGPGQSQVSTWFDDVSHRWRVGCGRCGCSTGISPRDKTETPAIEAWNRRSGGWRLFETAPRDGSRVLATGGGLGETVEIVSYNERVACWDAESCTLEDGDDDAQGYNRPERWMPLPATSDEMAKD